jgi:hypothetical protein
MQKKDKITPLQKAGCEAKVRNRSRHWDKVMKVVWMMTYQSGNAAVH